ncbi:MAG: hypothetical protein SGPRY_014050, partial [Prymnesium sp.]
MYIAFTTMCAKVAEISALIDRLAPLNPTPDPASSRLLRGRWDIVWTTEAELLVLTSKVGSQLKPPIVYKEMQDMYSYSQSDPLPQGFFGIPCSAAYQVISSQGGSSSLLNRIEFEGEREEGGPTGFLGVESSCEPAAQGGRVDFKFSACTARWRTLQLPLPPVGTGWFE